MPEQAVDFISSVIQGMNSLQIAAPPTPSIHVTTTEQEQQQGEQRASHAEIQGDAHTASADTAGATIAKASVPAASFAAVTAKDPLTGDMRLCEYRHDYMDQLTAQWADQVKPWFANYHSRLQWALGSGAFIHIAIGSSDMQQQGTMSSIDVSSVEIVGSDLVKMWPIE